MLRSLLLILSSLVLTITTAEAQSPSLLRTVNFDVNNSIEYRNDRNGEDTWTIPTKYGDCEDSALLKRKILIEKGWKADDLKLVLVVRTLDLKSKKTIDYAHIILYVPSKDTVLDIPAATQGDRGFKKDEYSWNEYMRVRKFSPLCDIVNLSEGTMSAVTQRCGKRYY